MSNNFKCIITCRGTSSHPRLFLHYKLNFVIFLTFNILFYFLKKIITNSRVSHFSSVVKTQKVRKTKSQRKFVWQKNALQISNCVLLLKQKKAPNCFNGTKRPIFLIIFGQRYIHYERSEFTRTRIWFSSQNR